VLRDLAHAFRSLTRSPAYSILVISTLALGIGATAAIWSVVQGVLLRPLPFPEPERLLMLWQRAPGVGVAEDWFSPTQYFAIRRDARSFEESALIFGTNVTLTGDDAPPERLGALNVSSSFFTLLGIEPVLGRKLSPEDDAPSAPRKVLLTRRLYETRFRADPATMGRTIAVDGDRLEVVGVLPPLPLDGDLLPTLVTVPVFDLVTSLPVEDPGRTTRGSENYNVLVRVARSATPGEVEAELLRAAESFVKDPESLGAGLKAGTEYRIGAVPLLDQVVGPVRTPLLLLLGATGVLLLIACANVFNLVLTRGQSVRRQLALRTALGASRWELIKHSLLPSLLLSLAAGAAGLDLALAAVGALQSAAPPDLPRLHEIEVDMGVVAVSAGLSLGACLLFGLAPAFRLARVSPIEVLREGASAVKARTFGRGGSRYLVVVQVALSLVLAMGAGLLLRTFFQLRTVDPGFRPEKVLTFRLSLVGERYREAGSRDRFFDQFFDRLRESAPDVEAGGISMLPLTRGFAWTDFYAQDHDDSRDRIVADVHVVTPGYLEAMGIPLLSGRTFTRADGRQPLLVVVNRELAERSWSLETTVGKWLGRRPDERARVVGVVENVKHYGLGTEPRMTVFFPYEAYASRTLYGTVRSPDAPPALTARVTEAVRALDPEIPIYDVRTMTDRVGDSLARQEVLMTLLALLSAVALTLASIGLYGVLAFTVATHAREMGIRKAVGASGRDLYWLVLRGAGTIVGLGVAAGVAAALFAGRLIAGLLYEIDAWDPLSLAASVAIVLAVGLAASLIPARRAAGIDPMVTLKED